jgi:uncharacterized protein YjbI with pentapeptide repeats
MVASIVTGIGLVGMVTMLAIAAGVPGNVRASLQIDAIKYGLGSVAAGGATAALLLALRRQRLSEHAHRLEVRKQDYSEADSADRRVTELYTKAAEQLGSPDAAVRLAGLYSLERLAQNNFDQRQTIVNVICAYLRMPYTPPADEVSPCNSTDPISDLPLRPSLLLPPGGRDPSQELQVRLTAQRILIAHLQRPFPDGDAHPNFQARVVPADFWPNIDIDLSGAVLSDWYLRNAEVGNANFSNARFYGRASFLRTTFSGRAVFENTSFIHSSSFSEGVFRSTEDFGISFFGAKFSEDVSFGGAEFFGAARFAHAHAADRASFDRVRFHRAALFTETRFNQDTEFTSCKFDELVIFTRASFGGRLTLDGSKFEGKIYFGEAVIGGDLSLKGCSFIQGRPSEWPVDGPGV